MRLSVRPVGRPILAASAFIAACPAIAQPARPSDVAAEGHELRIDVTWTPVADAAGYFIERGAAPDGPFTRLNAGPQDYTVYSDYLGQNGVERFYRIAAVSHDGSAGPASAVTSARTAAMSTEDLLTSIQKAHFRYFWQFAHPVSGLAREGFRHPRDTCTAGGSGFGMLTIMVGAERGFVPRDAAAERLLRQVRFLEDVTPRYHGAWSHWINGASGATIPFAGPEDNGGDIVETAFLVQGMLTVARYFDRDTPVERELRERISRLWRSVEWDWYRGDPPQYRLRWHWSPDYHFRRGHGFGGNFNECMIVYVLGLSSPTHPLPPECYYEGWIGQPKTPTDYPYANGNEYYGLKLDVGWPMGGPLFFTHYSFLGLDPRYVADRYCNYYENSRTISLINRAHCIANPHGFKGYSELVWGLTASFTPGGYHAHEPQHDNGTITPTAALSAMAYVPDESIATLKHFYRELGSQLWGPFGFWDAFNPTRDWVSDTVIAIDQGPITPMIENHRTQLCWRMFMQNEDIVRGLKRTDLYDSTPARLIERARAHD